MGWRLPWSEVVDAVVDVDLSGRPQTLRVRNRNGRYFRVAVVVESNWKATFDRLRACAPPGHPLRTGPPLVRSRGQLYPRRTVPPVDAEPEPDSDRDAAPDALCESVTLRGDMWWLGGLGILVAGGLPFLLLVAELESSSGQRGWILKGAAAVLLAGMVRSLLRVIRLRMRVDPSGVRFHGTVRTRSFAWSDISKVRVLRAAVNGRGGTVEVHPTTGRKASLSVGGRQPIDAFLRACLPHTRVVETSTKGHIVEGEQDYRP